MAAGGLIQHPGDIRIGGVALARSSLRQARGQVGFLFNLLEDPLVFHKGTDDVAFGLLRRGTAPFGCGQGVAPLPVGRQEVGVVCEELRRQGNGWG